MSDRPDSELKNRLAATAHLAEVARFWTDTARDESAPDEVRAQAALYARAVRAEGNLPGGTV
jgi:hypothetical protein